MSYSAALEAIAALQTQPELREALLTAPEDALARLRLQPGLDPSAQEGLSQLSARSLQVLDAMSRFHRWTRVQEHLPWMDPSRRIELRPLLDHFLRVRAPRLLNREDALAFCLLVESLPPADQQDSPLPAAPLGPFLQALCRYERLRIQLAWGLADYGNPYQEILPFPVISLKAKLEHLEAGWPELVPGRVRVTLFKVPMLPAVTVREESLDDRTSSSA